MDPQIAAQIQVCCSTANDFIKTYYSMFDLKRAKMSDLYLNSATFVFNGNGVTGKENIQKLFNEIPITAHRVTALNAQPLVDGAVAANLTYVAQTGGTVQIDGKDSEVFQQSFVIRAEKGKWCIVSDIYRLKQ